MSSAPPCRLHVFLARTAPIGVVLRRGPSTWTRLSLWNTDTDVFEHGQWIRGRVFERRSDISSDGALLIAFIRDTSARRRPHQRADTWIAISRPPYFTALALWWVGGTYCTGGFFPSTHSVWPAWGNDPDQGQLPPWLTIAKTIAHVDRTNNWTDRTVYHNRRIRDGWQLVTEAPRERWQRQQPDGPLRLMLDEIGWNPRAFGGPHVVEYALRLADERVEALPDVTWADWDQRGRLVGAQYGRLLHWQVPGGPTVLADFNQQEPETLPPPPWAQTWPPPPK